MRTVATAVIALAACAAPSLAQEATTIEVAESEQFGKYLATGEGRPVYLFTTDTQGTADQKPQISCTSAECLEAWPLVTAAGKPHAGAQVQAGMLDTMDHEGQTVVTYNGWPLYYFAKDKGTEGPQGDNADGPQGNDVESFGGEWYLVTPAGEELHAE